MTNAQLTLLALLDAVAIERTMQAEKWGDQHHRPFYSEGARVKHERNANHYRELADVRAEENDQSWDAILLEEVYEALSETDPNKMIEEFVQVAAVALAAAESVSRLVVESEDAPKDFDEIEA